jgi:hypothetical protein
MGGKQRAKEGQFRWFRTVLVALALGGALLLALSTFATDSISVFAFTPGENGHPSSGNLTDLKGRAGDVTFAFKNNMTINCTGGNITQQFNMQLDYSITGGTLPAGSFVVVYLSPNQGAINNNSGGDEAGYIATVESNETSVSMAGLSGSGTLTFSLPVTDPFALSGGGVLGIIASDPRPLPNGTSWNTKTNSVNCGEALTSTPTKTATSSPTMTPTATSTPAHTATATNTPTDTPTATSTPR